MRSKKSRGSTILGLLESSGLIEILSDKPKLMLKDRDVMLYGTSYGDSVPEPVDRNHINILVIHKMIVLNKLWSQQEKYYYAPKFLNKYKFDLILCGDCHQAFYYVNKTGRIICNTGCITRHEATAYNMTYKPHFYMFDTKKRSMYKHIIPHESAKLVLSRSHIDSRTSVDRALESFMDDIEELKYDKGKIRPFKEVLMRVMKKGKVSKRVIQLIEEVMDEEITWKRKSLNL